MNSILLRTGAILSHALFNFIIVSYLTNLDISGRWISVAGFAIIIFILLILFIKHIVSFINFIKTRS